MSEEAKPYTAEELKEKRDAASFLPSNWSVPRLLATISMLEDELKGAKEFARTVRDAGDARDAVEGCAAVVPIFHHERCGLPREHYVHGMLADSHEYVEGAKP